MQKIEDRFNEGYNSDGERGPFWDVENIDGPQYFDEVALPDAYPLDVSKNAYFDEGNEYVA